MTEKGKQEEPVTMKKDEMFACWHALTISADLLVDRLSEELPDIAWDDWESIEEMASLAEQTGRLLRMARDYCSSLLRVTAEEEARS